MVSEATAHTEAVLRNDQDLLEKVRSCAKLILLCTPPLLNSASQGPARERGIELS